MEYAYETRLYWYFSYVTQHRSLECAVASCDNDDESCGCVYR